MKAAWSQDSEERPVGTRDDVQELIFVFLFGRQLFVTICTRRVTIHS